MSKIVKKSAIVAVIAVIFLIAGFLVFIAYISPPRDKIEEFNYPSEYFCVNAGNRIDYQTEGNCSAYASAYVLRHFGENADGEELVSEISRPFGFVPATSIAKTFNKRGYRAEARCGEIETLKARLAEGDPIIVFIRIRGDTHYAVAVGYDEENIYLEDSLKENSNVSAESYNRVIKITEFEAIWRTGSFLPDNIYVIINKSVAKTVAD